MLALFAAVSLQSSLKADLEQIRAKYNLPSICAGAVVDGKTVALEVVGVRRAGSTEDATTKDRYHWGSNTKSVTASLVGVLVQQGDIHWDTTLAELFPEQVGKMSKAWEKVTVLQILQHRGGFSKETYDAEPKVTTSIQNLQGKRYNYAVRALSQEPASPPGTKFEYSNRGYMVLGAGLEKLTGKPWEDLVRQEIFKPLELDSAGFGPQGWVTHTSEPWGHIWERNKWTPIPPSPNSDNAAIVGPAGTLHSSVPDMLKWVALQANEGASGGILEPSTFKVLHTPPTGADYAGGWITVPREWAGGLALTHAGSNTMNYALFWVAPKRKFGLAIAINAYSPEVQKAANDVATLLILRCCPKN